MLKTLVFGTIAAIAGKKLYESGALDEFIADARARLNSDAVPARAPVRQPAAPVK